MSENIEGKVVVITGASSGLGEATARRLAAEGAKPVLGARRLDRLRALASELGLPDEAVVQTDVTSRKEVRRLVDHAVETHGRIDVLINNAGLMPHSPLERGKVEDWERMIDVNLRGVLYGIAAALPHMIARKSGHIINVSSVAGRVVRPGNAVYAATKAGVLMISEGLRQEVKPHGIRTTVISPGAVATELPQSLTEPDFAQGVQGFYKAVAIPADSFARGDLRDEPARRCRRQRNTVPSDRSGRMSFASKRSLQRFGVHERSMRAANSIKPREVDDEGDANA